LNENRGKFINFAKIGGICKFCGNSGGNVISIIDLRGMDAPGRTDEVIQTDLDDPASQSRGVGKGLDRERRFMGSSRRREINVLPSFPFLIYPTLITLLSLYLYLSNAFRNKLTTCC